MHNPLNACAWYVYKTSVSQNETKNWIKLRPDNNTKKSFFLFQRDIKWDLCALIFFDIYEYNIFEHLFILLDQICE